MIRFECGRSPNENFKITDAQTGAHLTSAIMCRKLDVLLSVRPNEPNRARMEAYVEDMADRILGLQRALLRLEKRLDDISESMLGILQLQKDMFAGERATQS